MAVHRSFALIACFVAAAFALRATSPKSGVVASAQQGGPATDIRDLTHAVNAAYAANDLDKYFSYYADDLTQWWPSGRVSLASYRESWTKFVKSGGRVEAADVSDLDVQLGPSGDTAIATYRLTVRTRSPKGEITTEENQETDVWFRRSGRWTIVHLHYSPAPKER